MTGIAWSYEDPSAAAKVVKAFRKETTRSSRSRPGSSRVRFSPASAVENQLATMPGKNELRAMLLATLQAPLQQFVQQLNAPAPELRVPAQRQGGPGRRQGEADPRNVREFGLPRALSRRAKTGRNAIGPAQQRFAALGFWLQSPLRSEHRRRGTEFEGVVMADITREQVVDYLSNLPVIQIAELIKTLEDKWGVKAAPVAVAARPAPAAAAAARRGRGEDRVRRRSSRTPARTRSGHQGGPRDHRPRPQGGEGPRRGRAQDRQGGRVQGRRRGHEEEARRGRCQGRAQVRLFRPSASTASGRRQGDADPRVRRFAVAGLARPRTCAPCGPEALSS